ncbi:MAG TPA: hypothetical protein VJN43_21635 [Bryobacteraceae bacterium]|nr:hypothetical protein [Bryobacteraceae bacterium]
MNARLVRQLVNLYPPEWRTRYRGEFEDLLRLHAASPSTILNVIAWAVYERALSLGAMIMDRRQNSVAFLFYAYLAAIAAGVNFYWTVEDTPLAVAMHTHAKLFTSWSLVQTGAILALIAAVLASIPVFLATVRTAIAAGRRDVVCRLGVPFGAGLVVLTWLIAAACFTAGHWVPTPWDVTGDWAAPANWPPLNTRIALSSVTLVLTIAGVIASTIGVTQIIGLSDLSRQKRVWFVVSSLLLAVSVVTMVIGVSAWGWFAQQYAATDFHARNGGFFSSTNVASWTASWIVFVAAAGMAVQSVRSALALRAE